jgi:hypothetical protein
VEFAKVLEVACVVMVLLLHQLKIVSLQIVDVAILTASSKLTQLFAVPLLEFVIKMNIALELLLLVQLMQNNHPHMFAELPRTPLVTQLKLAVEAATLVQMM